MTDLAPALRIQAWRDVRFMAPLPSPLSFCASPKPKRCEVREAPALGFIDLGEAVKEDARARNRELREAEMAAALERMLWLAAPSLADAPRHPRMSMPRRARLVWAWLMMPLHD